MATEHDLEKQHAICDQRVNILFRILHSLKQQAWGAAEELVSCALALSIEILF